MFTTFVCPISGFTENVCIENVSSEKKSRGSYSTKQNAVHELYRETLESKERINSIHEKQIEMQKANKQHTKNILDILERINK